MGYAIQKPVAKSRRRTSSSSEKSASGDFFGLTENSSLKNSCNSLKTRQEKSFTPTKTAQGVLFEHYRYTAFGEPEIYSPTGTKLAASAIDNPVLWNSRRYDEQTQLYYYKYRHYKADIGRWLGRDPIEEEGGYNLYGFVGNEPLLYADVLGTFALSQPLLDLLNNLFGGNGDEPCCEAEKKAMEEALKKAKELADKLKNDPEFKDLKQDVIDEEAEYKTAQGVHALAVAAQTKATLDLMKLNPKGNNKKGELSKEWKEAAALTAAAELARRQRNEQKKDYEQAYEKLQDWVDKNLGDSPEYKDYNEKYKAYEECLNE